MSDLDGGRHSIARVVVWYGLPPLLWMGFIFFLSAQSDLPGPPQSWLYELFSSAGHFTAYALLAFWWQRALGRISTVPGDKGRSKAIFLLAFLIVVSYGLSDEFHQSFVPSRDPSLADLAVDALGAATALGVIAWRKTRT